MGFVQELKKLTQPYEDDEDTYDGATVSPKVKVEAQQPRTGNAQKIFESTFAAEEPPAPEVQEQKAQGEGGGLFSSLGIKKPVRQQKPQSRERFSGFGSSKESQLIMFAPKSFDEAGELVNYMMDNMTVALTLDGVPTDMARRLLDFLSGIAFALQGKIIPMSGKTYFITPKNVDILGAEEPQQPEPETTSHYF